MPCNAEVVVGCEELCLVQHVAPLEAPHRKLGRGLCDISQFIMYSSLVVHYDAKRCIRPGHGLKAD